MLKRILIVDDDSELAEELAEILREEGYWVENVSDSSLGSSLIKEKKYDIYLFDYKMTGLNGIDLLKKVKEKDPRVPVFIVSGRPFVEKLLKEENVHSLVSGVIKKPFDVQELLKKIKAFA
jgi:DNA-binding response OmpR family regulator